MMIKKACVVVSSSHDVAFRLFVNSINKMDSVRCAIVAAVACAAQQQHAQKRMGKPTAEQGSSTAAGSATSGIYWME